MLCCLSFVHHTHILTDFQSRFRTTSSRPKDAKGYAYFASITAYKVATGNANGPSTTSPSLINTVDFSAAANDGTVRQFRLVMRYVKGGA